MELQGRVQFPTGGKAHEPRRKQSMIRCNSEADSKVWMEEVILKLVIHNVIIVE